MPSSLIDDAPEGVNTPEFTVSELSGAVKRMVEGEFGHVRVRGEIGRVSRPRSGHIYLDLKDDRAVLAAVVWKGVGVRLDIEPTEGDEVIAEGRLTTFPGQSKYQLVIEHLAYAGEGALLAKLERLRKALAAEGLFDQDRKQPIPYLPRVIGVVTSPSGAVIRDILHRLAERFPVRVLVWPVAVQGEKCVPEVTAAIRGFNALKADGPIPRPDVIIVARGGGSIEDLWGFNDEAVVRAAAESRIPLISAVGHETDTTLIDHAADRRAPTPTAAAEMAVPVRADLLATLADLGARRLRAMSRGLGERRQRLGDLARALPRPEQILADRRQRLDVAIARLPRLEQLILNARNNLEKRALRLGQSLRERLRIEQRRLSDRTGRFGPWLLTGRIQKSRARLDGLVRLFASLHYESTLKRGYAVVRSESAVLTRAAQVRPGMGLELEFADGRVRAEAGDGGGTPASDEKPRKIKPAKKKDGGQGSLF
ncbi:MAG: exodeoxyribonuclease VII large subunit [Paracoccaceae bacterium]|nr:exodeoxyribonuclease VII large subunit [Paracoccaceae bacterium]